MGSSRRPANELQPFRQHHRFGHRRRPAEDRQHGARCPERHRDLIHDPARCAHHTVLRLLAERGQAERIDAPCAEGPRRRDFERRARSDADGRRQVRRDLDPPAGRADDAVAHEHQRHTDEVVRPSGMRRQFPAHGRVVQSGQALELARRERRRADHEALVGTQRDLGPLPGRHLEHERPGVVGHATEEVEAARRSTPHPDRPPARPTPGRYGPPASRWHNRPMPPGRRCPTAPTAGRPRGR